MGSLLLHRAVNYEKARKNNWICIRACIVNNESNSSKNTNVAMDDYYVNGLSGECVYDTPLEIMSVEEKGLKKAFDKVRKKLEDSVQVIEGLQFEIGS